MPKPGEGDGRYMAGLDGLRALAVIVVIAYHLNVSFVPGGFLGVGVFFVLSGYLVTDLLLSQRQRSGTIDLKNFWVRRFRRLLPALLLTVAGVVGWIALTNPSQLSALRGDILATLFYGNNWWLLYHQVSYFDSFTTPKPFLHLWSLAVEGQFYLVWPLLLLIGLRYAPRRGQLAGWIVLGTAASALAMAFLYEPGADPSRVYYGTDTRVFALFIGALLAVLWPSRRTFVQGAKRVSLKLDALGAAGLLVILAMIWKINEYDDFLYQGGFVILSLATALVIAALVHPASYLGKCLGWKPLRWIGVRSYGIYLWHYPIIILTSPKVNTNGMNLTLVLFQVAASILLAALSWKYIEEPIRRGALSKLWNKTRSRDWSLRRVSFKQWAAAACALLVLSGFGIGMTSHSPVAVVSAANSAVKDKKEETAVLPPVKHQLKKQVQPRQGVKPNITKTPKNETPPLKAVKPSQPKHPVKQNSVSLQTYGEWSVSVIGDSVMLDAAPYLQKMLPGSVVDAEIGRQMSKATEVLNTMKRQGTLGQCVVIGLGTNGIFSKKKLESLLSSLEGVEHIVLVNVRMPDKWQDPVNSILSDAAAESAKVSLIDWYSYSAGHDEYFEPDATHLVPNGAKAYANLIVEELKSFADSKKHA